MRQRQDKRRAGEAQGLVNKECIDEVHGWLLRT